MRIVVALKQTLPSILIGFGIAVPAMLSVVQALHAQPVMQGVVGVASVDYYDVTGASWAEIKQSIYAKRLAISGTDQRFEGRTSDVIEIIYSGSGILCSLNSSSGSPSDSVTVRVTERMTVPHLINQAHLSDLDRECLAAYDRDLTDHEEGHVRKAIERAEALLTALRANHPTTCQDFERLRFEQFIKLQQAQADYDALTDHGKLQYRANNGAQPLRAYAKMGWCQ